MSTKTSTFTCKDLGGFKRTLKAALLAAEHPNILPILATLNMNRDGDDMVIYSTDRYRMVRARVPGEWTGSKDFSCNLTSKFARLIVRDATAANIKMQFPALLRFAPAETSYKVGEETVTSPCALQEGDYPKVAKLMDDAAAHQEPVDHFAFSPHFMADLCAMQPGSGPVNLRSTNGAERPYYSEWKDGEIRLEHILMPVRFTS